MMMTKEDKLDCLMLLSALESYCMAGNSSNSYPDYLAEFTSNVVANLRADILCEDE